MPEVFTVVTEKKARKIIDKGGDVVFIHTRENCPICDTFLPDVLKPIFAKEKYKGIEIYQMMEPMTFPVGQHPITYFFKEGRCIQHPAGQTTIENVEQLLDTFYLGVHTIDEWNQGQRPPGQQGPPGQQRRPPKNITPQNPPMFEINTDKRIV
jgi:hypothetical protein